MWKLLLLTLYTLNCCWAGPVVLKRNMSVTKQIENSPANNNVNSHDSRDSHDSDNSDDSDMTIYEEQQKRREESFLASSFMHMQTLNLPSNATSIRTHIIDGFSCQNRTYGYYADIENDCQIFHICLPVKYANGKESMFRWSFICPEETVFSQDSFICMRPDDMTIKCEESYEYYALNRNFGIIDNTMEMDKDIDMDNTMRPHITDTKEETGEHAAMPEITLPNQYDDKDNNRPVKQSTHRPNRPKPNSSFTFIHNRPKISSQPLRKIPSTIQTDEIIQETSHNTEITLKPVEEKIVKDIKPINQRYTKRPLLNTPKEKISNNKVEDKIIVKPNIYNMKRKRPLLSNNKKLIGSVVTTPAIINENSDMTKNDKDEANFFKTESNTKPDMSNKYFETELADTDSQSSEKKIIFIKPQQQIKTDNIFNIEKYEEASKPEGNLNMDIQKKASIERPNNLTQNAEKPKQPNGNFIPYVEMELTSAQLPTVEQASEIDNIENSQIAISNDFEITGDSDGHNEMVESTNAQNDLLDQTFEKITENVKTIENSETDSTQHTSVNDDKNDIINRNDDEFKNDSPNEINSNGISNKIVEEMSTDMNQPIEEMEAERPSEAPESVLATDDMLQQAASIEEMFGDFKPTNSYEAEKLIVDFLNKIRNTEETAAMATLESDDVNNNKEIIMDPKKALSDQTLEDSHYKDSETEIEKETDITNKESIQPELEIFKEDKPNKQDLKEDDTAISLNQIPIHSETLNDNNENMMNVKKLFPFNEPQITEENIEDTKTNEREKNVLIDKDESNVYEENDKSLSFDDVVHMVKEHLEHMPQPQNEMDHNKQILALTNGNINKSIRNEEKVEEVAELEENKSNIKQINADEYIVPIYHRVPDQHNDSTYNMTS